MFQKNVLQQEIEAALNSKSADPVLAEKRKFGLRFIVEAKPGQSLDDVAGAFHRINDRFKAEPLFPAPLFVYPEPDPALAWHNTAFVAAVEDVTFDDVSMNPWDVAHAARNEGGFVRVAPDVATLAPEPPAAVPETAANEPGPGWETVTMRIKEAWAAFERRGLKLPGSNVVIGHPDSGWYPHEAWDKGNLDIAKSRNFMPKEDPYNAQDPLTGAQPGHGNSTASVMVSPHGLPVVGVAPHAVVIPIRCISTVVLYPFQKELIQAIAYAVQQRCRVISISLGGLPLDVFLGDVIRDAVAANVIVVAAAGQDLPLRPTVEPAAWKSFVIGVAGIEGVGTGFRPWDPSGRWPYGSIAISAPASPVYRAKAVPNRRNVYENSTGTSYATAFMAGIAALWLSYHFRMGYTGTRRAQYTFKEHVQRTVQKPRGFDDWFYGVVDAEKLMTTAPLPNAKGLEDEREMDISSASQFAHLLGEANYEKANHLLSAVILGTRESTSTEAAENLEPWSGEIVAILQRNPELRMELSKRAEGSALTAQTLKQLVAPHASDALRNQFAAAEKT